MPCSIFVSQQLEEKHRSLRSHTFCPDHVTCAHTHSADGQQKALCFNPSYPQLLGKQPWNKTSDANRAILVPGHKIICAFCYTAMDA